MVRAGEYWFHSYTITCSDWYFILTPFIITLITLLLLNRSKQKLVYTIAKSTPEIHFLPPLDLLLIRYKSTRVINTSGIVISNKSEIKHLGNKCLTMKPLNTGGNKNCFIFCQLSIEWEKNTIKLQKCSDVEKHFNVHFYNLILNVALQITLTLKGAPTSKKRVLQYSGYITGSEFVNTGAPERIAGHWKKKARVGKLMLEVGN